MGLDTGAKKATPDKPFTVNGIVVDWDGKISKRLKKVNLQMVVLMTKMVFLTKEMVQRVVTLSLMKNFKKLLIMTQLHLLKI